MLQPMNIRTRILCDCTFELINYSIYSSSSRLSLLNVDVAAGAVGLQLCVPIAAGLSSGERLLFETPNSSVNGNYAKNT
jgi:hypothetical protein